MLIGGTNDSDCSSCCRCPKSIITGSFATNSTLRSVSDCASSQSRLLCFRDERRPPRPTQPRELNHGAKNESPNSDYSGVLSNERESVRMRN